MLLLFLYNMKEIFMFKKLFTCGCLLSMCHMSGVLGASAHQTRSLSSVECASQLKPCLMAIQKVPEARQLIETVQKEGWVRVVVNNTHLSNQFGAYWDGSNRTIAISVTSDNTQGDIIASIIFELHNASVDSKFDYLDSLAAAGQIDREGYIRAVEYIEFQNSISAHNIAEKGIKMGVFPVRARLHVYRNFEEHYYYQQVGGHSAYIGKNFDMVAPKYNKGYAVRAASPRSI